MPAFNASDKFDSLGLNSTFASAIIHALLSDKRLQLYLHHSALHYPATHLSLRIRQSLGAYDQSGNDLIRTSAQLAIDLHLLMRHMSAIYLNVHERSPSQVSSVKRNLLSALLTRLAITFPSLIRHVLLSLILATLGSCLPL